MDVFGTVSAAISLVEKVKAIFDQVDQNKNDCAVFSAEIVKALLNVQQFWQQHSLNPPKELRDGLSEFELELRSINASLASLLKPSKEGALGSSLAKLNEVYNVNDIQNELISLRQKVQTCQQQLQLWSNLRTESRVAAMHEDMIARLEELRMLLPGSNPQRRETLGQIEEELPSRISAIDPSYSLQLELSRIQSRDSLQVAPSIKSAKFSIRSLSPSFVDKRYLKDKVKEISKVIPQVCDEVLRQSSFTRSKQFRGLDNVSSNMNRSDSIKETIRVLEILQSGKQVPYIETAKDLLRLGGALRDLGMQAQAILMYDWGVQICFKLAALEGPKSMVDLVKFLHNLSLNFDGDGQRIDAEWTFEQAVKARCQLAEMGERGYLGTLASFLTSTVKRLANENRLDACSRTTKETVEVYHKLVRLDQDRNFADLSQSAHSLAIDLDEAGLTEDAIKMGEGAVMMRRELVKKDRKTYLPDLSLSLYNHANHLNKIGWTAEAVNAGEEAIMMHRELVKKDRKTYLRNLSFSLYNHATHLHKIGRTEEAVKIGEEAVVMLRELVEKDRKTYLPDLSWSLHNLAVHLNKIGRTEEAVKVGEEAIRMRRKLVEKDPKTYLPNLSLSLYNYANHLMKIGRSEEAVKVGEEAIKVLRDLVQKDRKTYLPSLENSLSNHAAHLDDIGRTEEAVNTGEEAVQICRELVKMDSKYTSDLAMSLENLAIYLQTTERHEDAKTVEEELSGLRQRCIAKS
ncbi:hypothetical protein FRC02_000267 [Tulasnella sp. 418]|nr:hypothetical protein FRC02_000267 [Tulasnella sp. 418]